MLRNELLSRAAGNYNKTDMLNWIATLPKDGLAKPDSVKRGDVYMHVHFNHPIVVLSIRKCICICCTLSTNSTRCMLEPTNSRFFKHKYFTTCLVMITLDEISKYSFMNVFDNNKQLRQVLKKLVNVVK